MIGKSSLDGIDGSHAHLSLLGECGGRWTLSRSPGLISGVQDLVQISRYPISSSHLSGYERSLGSVNACPSETGCLAGNRAYNSELTTNLHTHELSLRLSAPQACYVKSSAAGPLYCDVSIDLLGARFKTCEASQVGVPCFDLNKSDNFDGS